jgi:hypothetical protein
VVRHPVPDHLAVLDDQHLGHCPAVMIVAGRAGWLEVG